MYSAPALSMYAHARRVGVYAGGGNFLHGILIGQSCGGASAGARLNNGGMVTAGGGDGAAAVRTMPSCNAMRRGVIRSFKMPI